MPDSNDGDVGVFPFMKREVAKLGGGTTRDEIVTCVKEAWTHVTPKVCKNIRARVMRNLKWVATRTIASGFLNQELDLRLDF